MVRVFSSCLLISSFFFLLVQGAKKTTTTKTTTTKTTTTTTTIAATTTIPSSGAISFSGYQWNVKDSAGAKVGPGPNYFSSSNIAVDGSGHLVMTISNPAPNKWVCAEVYSQLSFGYGTYEFQIGGPDAEIDVNAILGLFTYDTTSSAYNYREIDVEIARWGLTSDPTNSQYVVQPYDSPNHLQRFYVNRGTKGTHKFTWRGTRIDWASVGANSGSSSFSFTDPAGVPVPGNEKARINLWLNAGNGLSSGSSLTVTINAFHFTRSKMGSLAPLYVYPSASARTSSWSPVTSTGSSMATSVIINPNNGDDAVIDCSAGTITQSDWAAAVNLVNTGGSKGIGYVYSSYGSRDINAILPLIQSYLTCWGLGGIFVDEASTDPAKVPFYTQIYNYVKSINPNALVILNPGTNTNEQYVAISDVIVVFESPYTSWVNYAPSAFMSNYPASKFAMMVTNTPTSPSVLVNQIIDQASVYNIGWSYVLMSGQSYSSLTSSWSTQSSFISTTYDRP